MDAQRKVTSFVTRGAGEAAELLVFWHLNSGIQVPAGSVEEGESFEQAAIREVFEETALQNLELLRQLGLRKYSLLDGWAVLRRETNLRTRPEAGAPTTKWRIPRASVGVIERKAGFARVVYAEEDLDRDDGLVFARFEGWVAEEDLYSAQERAFFHFRAGPEAPEEWETIENGEYEFHLYWVPLVPRPALVASNQAWLDEFYDPLMADVREAAAR